MKELIRLVAHADKDCDGKYSKIHKVGIADSSPGSCSMTWLKGWEVGGGGLIE